MEAEGQSRAARMRRFSKRRASDGVLASAEQADSGCGMPHSPVAALSDGGGKRTCLGSAAGGCHEAATHGDSGRAAEHAGPTERSCAVHGEGCSSILRAAPQPNRRAPQPNNNIMLALRARETDPRGNLGQVSDTPVPRTLAVGGAHLILQCPRTRTNSSCRALLGEDAVHSTRRPAQSQARRVGGVGHAHGHGPSGRIAFAAA